MRKKKILIVDEDQSVQKMLSSVLQMDYECVSVSNGEDGISYLENNVGKVDLMIADLYRSGMDGYKMLESMENNFKHKNIPVLMIVSPEKTEDITHAFSAGADDVISQPVNPDILRKRVSNMLRVGGDRMVHNVMEDLILEQIDECISDLGICTCPVCRRDLLTLTLNRVTPKYVTSEKGAAITKAERMASRDEKLKLLMEIASCAQMVKQRPNHG